MTLEAAGAAWCAKFPTSKATADLIEPFRGNVERFIAALQKQGASVNVAATYRPPERAYLMHMACSIAGYTDKASGRWVRIDPFNDAASAALGIDWTCGSDPLAARKAAEAMCACYGIVYPAALESRHTQRRAVDMAISWKGSIWLYDADGKSLGHIMRASALTDQFLAIAGKSFGVIKLVSDPPHWSDDGH